MKTGNIWCDISDHLPNYIFIMNNKDNQEKTKKDPLPLIRLYAANNMQKFKNKVHAWFHSYLSDRKQTTLYCDNYSKFKTIRPTCGVLQGSVLGPLLFLIFF